MPPPPRRPQLVLATRQSPLALRQAEIARAALLHPGPGGAPRFERVALLKLTTTGDRQRAWSLAERGGKGLFTRELEDAVLDGRADFAVHSAKDLPTTLPAGLVLCACLPRADARDVLVRRADANPPRVVATGSPRRRAQAQAWWPEAQWVELRGNVRTRLQKIAAGAADATFLAAAGLARLEITHFEGLVFEPLPIARMVPAAGQGAIALEGRARSRRAALPGACADTTRAVRLERKILAALGGGCHAASAVHYTGAELHVFHAPRGYARWRMAPAEAWRTGVERVRQHYGLD